MRVALWIVFALAPASMWAQAGVTVVVPVNADFNSAGLTAGQLGFGWSAGSPVARRMYSTPYSQLRVGVANGVFQWNNPFLYSGWYGSYAIVQSNQGMHVSSGPSYANPIAVQPAPAQAAPLEAPPVPPGAEWADVRSSFTSASSNVWAARGAVEDMRARLAAMGQSPRASLVTGVASAEAALKAAQGYITAARLEEARTETQRAAYLARQVLREFGR